jgi:hypothetical protein
MVVDAELVEGAIRGGAIGAGEFCRRKEGGLCADRSD